MTDTKHPYSGLGPEVVLDALESVGLRGDGRMLSLNSYENRVYQAYLEDPIEAGGLLRPPAPPHQATGPHDAGAPVTSVVTKFYRPERWSDAQIAEEHAFALELAAREVPVVAPTVIGGRTLHVHGGFRFAVYPRRGGRSPDLEDPKVLEWVGRFIGRIHAVGAQSAFVERPALDPETFGIDSRNWLLENDFVPEDLEEAWTSIADLALDEVERAWEAAQGFRSLRLHGDCHPGNILWTQDGPHFVDLDDARTGPAMQDLWMLVSGDRRGMARQLKHVIDGYEQFFAFDRRELCLLEALRTLRLLHYSAWIARRWDDPAFPAAFPWFNTQRYWQDRILELREQVAAMEELPLELS